MTDINAEIERLKTEAASTSASVSKTVQVDPLVAKTAYEESQLLSLSVLGLGVFILCCLTYLIRAGRKYDEVLRTFITTLIVIAAVFLIVAGYSEKQIAPVIGLLGTIAGYVLGRNERSTDSQSQKDNAG